MYVRSDGPGPLLTIEEFERLPDDDTRTELVRGRLVREPLAGGDHGRVAAEVAYLLRRFLDENRVGTIFGAETGFILGRDPPTVRGPDAAFVRADRMGALGATGYFPGPPDLAVEVVSPSNTAAKVRAKVRDYLDAGTRLVWVVYPRSRTVVVHRALEESRLLRETDVLKGEDVLPGFSVEVRRVFG